MHLAFIDRILWNSATDENSGCWITLHSRHWFSIRTDNYRISWSSILSHHINKAYKIHVFHRLSTKSWITFFINVVFQSENVLFIVCKSLSMKLCLAACNRPTLWISHLYFDVILYYVCIYINTYLCHACEDSIRKTLYFSLSVTHYDTWTIVL